MRGRNQARGAAAVPLFIALPGALGGTAAWQAMEGELFPNESGRLLAWDLADDAMSIGTQGLDAWASHFTASVARRFSGRSLVLMGYSMGARLALHCLRQPGLNLAGMVIVSGHPGLRDASERPARLAEDVRWADKVRGDSWENVLADWEARPVFATGIPLAHWRPELRRVWEADRAALEARREGVARSLDAWSLGRQDDLRGLVSAATIPILWLTGGRDEKFTRLAAEVAPPESPCITRQIIANAGHRVQWECPEAFTKAVAAWLSLRAIG